MKPSFTIPNFNSLRSDTDLRSLDFSETQVQRRLSRKKRAVSLLPDLEHSLGQLAAFSPTIDLSTTPPELRAFLSNGSLSESPEHQAGKPSFVSSPVSARSSVVEFDFTQTSQTGTIAFPDPTPQQPAPADRTTRALERSSTAESLSLSAPKQSRDQKRTERAPAAPTASADIFAGGPGRNSQTSGLGTPLSRVSGSSVSLASSGASSVNSSALATDHYAEPPWPKQAEHAAAENGPKSSTAPEHTLPPRPFSSHRKHRSTPHDSFSPVTSKLSSFYRNRFSTNKKPASSSLSLISGCVPVSTAPPSLHLPNSPLPLAPPTTAENGHLANMAFEGENIPQGDYDQPLLQIEQQKLLLRRQQQHYQYLQSQQQQRRTNANSAAPQHARNASSIDMMDSDEYENILHNEDTSSSDTDDDLYSQQRHAGSSGDLDKRATMTRQTVLDEFESDIRDLLLLNSASPFSDLNLNFVDKKDKAVGKGHHSHAPIETPSFYYVNNSTTSNMNTPTAAAFTENSTDSNVAPSPSTETGRPKSAKGRQAGEDTFIFSQDPVTETAYPSTPAHPVKSMATATSSPQTDNTPSAPVLPASQQFENASQMNDRHSVVSDTSSNTLDMNTQTPVASGSQSSILLSNAGHTPTHKKTTSQRLSTSARQSPTGATSSRTTSISSSEEPQEKKESRFFHRKNGSTKSTFGWLTDYKNADKRHEKSPEKHTSLVTPKDERRPSLAHKTSHMSLPSKFRNSSAFRLSSIVSSSSDHNPNVITNLNYHQHIVQPPLPYSSNRPASANFIPVPVSATKPRFSDLQSNPSNVSSWFLKQVALSHSQEVGLFLTEHLFLPANLWRLLPVTPKLLETRIECIEAVTKLGESFYETTSGIGADDPDQQRRNRIYTSAERLLGQQSAQLINLEQKFHIAFIEPLSATPLISQLDGSANSSQAPSHSLRSPTANSSFVSQISSYSSTALGRKSRNSSGLSSSMGEPLSSSTSMSSTIADSASMKKRESQDWDSTATSAQDQATCASETRTSTGKHRSDSVREESSLTLYLTALSGLLHVLEKLNSLANTSASANSSDPVNDWVAGYRQFTSRCVCRLVLKDVLFLVDVYQTGIRDWILS